jgi:hypothetical protein
MATVAVFRRPWVVISDTIRETSADDPYGVRRIPTRRRSSLLHPVRKEWQVRVAQLARNGQQQQVVRSGLQW